MVGLAPSQAGIPQESPEIAGKHVFKNAEKYSDLGASILRIFTATCLKVRLCMILSSFFHAFRASFEKRTSREMQKLHFEREVLQKLTSGQENSDFAWEVARSREKVAYRVDGTPTLESMVSRETSRNK